MEPQSYGHRDYVEWSNPTSFSFLWVILGGKEHPAVSRPKSELGVSIPNRALGCFCSAFCRVHQKVYPQALDLAKPVS